MSRTKTQEEKEKMQGAEGARMKEPKFTIAKMQQRDSVSDFPCPCPQRFFSPQALHAACQVREARSALSPAAPVHRPDNSRLRQSLAEAPAHSDTAPMVILKPIFYRTPVRSQGELR